MLLALLRQYIRPYRRLVAVLMTLQIATTLASLYLPTVNAAIIDDGVSKGNHGTGMARSCSRRQCRRRDRAGSHHP